ncbi:MAG: hypothetical protein JSR65_00990 [Proteobacteria bacterium]|nr:hypothetical protein [Pseudomonadota bacterium]
MSNAVAAAASAFDTPRRWRIAGLAFAFALGVGCFAPGLRAFFAQDDFAFLALVRLLHQPWLLFIHNHFPDYAYFRPLGVLIWWSVAAVAGSAALPQYATNLVLHLACVAALYTLLQRLRHNAPLNPVWAALYAAHPLAIGTALWLSDRFDLLTTLFSLIALSAALAHVERPRATTLTAMLAVLLLALLSKELGVVAAAALFAAVALAPRVQLPLRQRVGALGAILAVTLGWLAYRHVMLATPLGGGLRLPATAVFLDGFCNWLRTGAAYLFADPRAARWSAIALACAGAAWSVAGLAIAKIRGAGTPRLHVAVALFTLILLPGLVQAPVAYKHLAGTLGADAFFFHLIVPSRFFHLSFAALVCTLALLTTPRSRTGSVWPLRLGASGLALALLACAPLSHRLAHDYASGTRKDAAALAAVERALDRSAIPTHGCQIYFLHTASLWGFDGYSDAIAKGLAAQPERLAHCLIATERPPYVYFIRAESVSPADYRPLHPLAFAGKRFPTLAIGDVEAIYLTMGADIANAIPATAMFLDYRDGAFVDVSAAVRNGELKVDFATTKPD